MKDALVNLLVFLLVFVAAAVLFLANYGIYSLLVPGGRGLIFSNPFAAALFPALGSALVVALYRAVRKPGQFRITWGLLALSFFFLLGLSIPVIQQAPPVRSLDVNPALPGRFLTLDDGSQVLSTPPALVVIPASGQPMSVTTGTQFDPMNQRFVFPNGEPVKLGSTGPERAYFQYTPELISLQTDFLALYTILKDNAETEPFVYWFQVWAVTWLFLGLYFFFSFRTWPMVQVILVLLAFRLAVSFLVYAFWSVPALVDLWVPPEIAGWPRTWLPVILADVAASCLFFMSWVSKPHQMEALT